MPHCSLDDSVRQTIHDLWADTPLADAGLENCARRLLLDTLGCAIAGLATADVRELATVLGRTDPGGLKFPGLVQGLSPSAFLMVFSAAACAFEGPEGLASAQGRPGLHAVPAVLACALADSASLRRTLTAIVCGYELGGRIGQAYRILPGMHVDGTWGTFAALGGMARFLDLPVDTTLAALDGAACQLPVSLYHPIPCGSTLRNLYVGHGAVLARYAVEAARAGFPRAPGALSEHMRLLLGAARGELPQRKAASVWLVEEGYLKKYPVVKHVHYGIEAALRWRQAGGTIGENDRITLRVYRNALIYCGNRAPRSSIEAQFSLTWSLAWSLTRGTVTTATFMPDGLADPVVRALESRIVLEEDASLTQSDRRGATLLVSGPDRTDGPIVVDSVPGDPGTRAELVDKFNSGAAPVIGGEACARLVAAVLDRPLDEPLSLE